MKIRKLFGPSRLLLEGEIHGYRGHNFHGFAVKQSWLVFPLADRVDCSLLQQWVSANDLHFSHSSIPANDRFQNDHTLNARLLGKRWIHRLNLHDLHGLLDISTLTNPLRRWRRRRRRWRWRWRRRSGIIRCLQNSSENTGQNARASRASDNTNGRRRTFVDNNLDVLRDFRRCNHGTRINLDDFLNHRSWSHLLRR